MRTTKVYKLEVSKAACENYETFELELEINPKINPLSEFSGAKLLDPKLIETVSELILN